jgi:hypothetical protein
LISSLLILSSVLGILHFGLLPLFDHLPQVLLVSGHAGRPKFEGGSVMALGEFAQRIFGIAAWHEA